MTTSKESVLIIQIPCLNEEETLPKVIADLPKEVEGFSQVYTLVIDDGSTDQTFNVAQQLGVDYILRNPGNLGLAQSFIRGLEACLFLGADAVVNTDGDNQYVANDIVRLVQPLRSKRAMIVVGCRDITNHTEFSKIKKWFQKFGSSVVKQLSGYDIPDATSGFRAMDRLALLRMTVMSKFSYTIETLIQAKHASLNVMWIPISVNKKTRNSRLFTSLISFIYHQVKTMLHVFMQYRPTTIFNWIAFISLSISIALSMHIAYNLWFVDVMSQKFKIGSGLMVFFLLLVTFISYIGSLLGLGLSGQNHQIEDVRMRIRDISLNENIKPYHLNIFKSSKLSSWKHIDNQNVDNNHQSPSYNEI